MRPPTEERTDGAPVTVTATSPPSPATKLPPVYYTWSNLFTIMAGNASEELQRKYLDERDTVLEERDCKRCEKDRDWLLKYSPVVVFMKDEIAKLGGELNSKNIQCKRCRTDQNGGFNDKYGILLCANHLRNRGNIEDTMAHEMIHAWDYLKWKIDPFNLRQQACLEIRASTLSGECRFRREFFTRGQYKITEQLQECVRRRATLSVMARQGVKDDVHAAKLVNEVWDSCFNDPRPFDEIYR